MNIFSKTVVESRINEIKKFLTPLEQDKQSYEFTNSSELGEFPANVFFRLFIDTQLSMYPRQWIDENCKIMNLSVWWNFLKEYPMPIIEGTFYKFGSSEDGKKAPTPLDIIKRCKQTVSFFKYDLERYEILLTLHNSKDDS